MAMGTDDGALSELEGALEGTLRVVLCCRRLNKNNQWCGQPKGPYSQHWITQDKHLALASGSLCCRMQQDECNT